MRPSIEQCYHFGSTAMGGREEYCEIRGKDPEADIVKVTDSIDGVLYSALYRGPGGKIYESKDGYSRLERGFSLLSGENVTSTSPIIETNVTIDRVIKRSPEFVSYKINVSWRVLQSEELDEVPIPYITTYNLELWNASAQATITEIEYDFLAEKGTDLSPRQISDRPMTPYDYEVLLDLIRDIKAVQTGYTIETKPLT